MTDETREAAFHAALKKAYKMRYASLFNGEPHTSDSIYRAVFDAGYDHALAATPADPVRSDKADLTFDERAEKFRTERNQAWQEFREDSKAAGYTIEDNLANRTLFLSGYESGKSAKPADLKSLAAELALANKKVEILQASNDHYADYDTWETSLERDNRTGEISFSKTMDLYIGSEGNGSDVARKTQEKIARLEGLND